MKGFSAVFKFLKNAFCYPKWRCVLCGKDVFEDKYFCDKCYDALPFNNGIVCEHCGRKVIAEEKYCSTCKGVLTNIDRARSVFVYAPPINKFIKRAKYFNEKYLLGMFAEFLSSRYFSGYFNSDVLCFVPMTDKAEKKRGYNQSRILAELVSKRTGVPVADAAIKNKETPKQVGLSAEKRRKNLYEAFKITDKKAIADKKVLIIDDVTTTGATGEALAKKLKDAGAARVELLTVASVPPKDGY